LLAERVTLLEAAVYSLSFASERLDENLVSHFHSEICSDLIPDWAGQWRTVDVRVGRLHPPSFSQVPILMKDYGQDLNARWEGAAGSLSDLTLEFLAFAEGRFLHIHPFADFNGRTVRVFLLEILRRLDLPRVELAPQTEEGRSTYFSALEAADRSTWGPLMDLWKSRFLEVP
jgi:CRISPR-associated endonuclease/helicase Cas3